MALVITVEDNNIKVAKIPLQPKEALLATAEIYSKTWQYLVPKNRISKEESGVQCIVSKNSLKTA